MTTPPKPEPELPVPVAASTPASDINGKDNDNDGDDDGNIDAQAKALSSTPESDDGGTNREAHTDDTEPTIDTSSPSSTPAIQSSPGDWQAIWSPAHNAYYFYNPATQETTWTNPVQSETPPATVAAESISTADDEVPVAPTSSATPAHLAHLHQLQAAAAAQGIDPSLAYLDPSLAAAVPAVEGYTAKFNARTGAFARPDGRDPTHLSEYERAKRMSEFYFDVNQWQEDVEARKLQEEAEGKKRKRPTKKDLDRYKEQKKAKKIAKTAWLRT